MQNSSIAEAGRHAIVQNYRSDAVVVELKSKRAAGVLPVCHMLLSLIRVSQRTIPMIPSIIQNNAGDRRAADPERADAVVPSEDHSNVLRAAAADVVETGPRPRIRYTI